MKHFSKWSEKVGLGHSKSSRPTGSTVPAPRTPPASATVTALVTTPAPSNSPEHLWNTAYAQAKGADAAVVEAYEKVLSSRLDGTDPLAGSSALQPNRIAQDPAARAVQMRQLTAIGLQRTAKAIAARRVVTQGIQAVQAVKDVVSSAVQASPQAAVAWVGVCFALEVRCRAARDTRTLLTPRSRCS